MASLIKIKRSTGTIAPTTLQYGELAYTTGVGTHGNSGGRLFIGDNVPNAVAVGGRYYTDLLSISPGLVSGQGNPTTPSNGFVPILDQNRKVDQWNVDNLTLDGNTLSSTNTDGDVIIDPNGSGEILVPDDKYLTFGTSKDVKIRYDEAVDDRLEIEGADWNFANGVSLSFSDSTQSTSTTTGALTVSGGVGISGNLFVGGSINVSTIVGTISTATRSLTVDTTTASNNIYYPGLFVSSSGTLSTSVYVDSGISYNSNTDTLTLSGNLNVDGSNPILASTSTGTLTLFNSNIAAVNAFQDASNISIGSTTGITTVRNTLIVTGNLEIDGNNIQASDGNTNITLTSNTLTTFSGDIKVLGNDIQSSSGDVVVTFDSNNATFANNLTVNGTTNLGNQSTDLVNILGSVYHTGVSTNVGGAYFDAIGISSNSIYTRSGTGDKIYIDPYPDGLSNEGTVIIKGDLQVDGTTVTVNSVTVTSNNPIYVIGDNATTRTVVVTAASGNQLTIDSVAGINTSDVVSGNNIPTNTIISSFDSGTKVITLSNSITGTVDSGSQITISQGIDTNDDRGVAFKYVSSGIGTLATVKTGFFGYVDNTSRWTYIPDAGIAGNIVTGTKGFLDIKGIYYQSGDYSTNGITYFDSSGLMRSTVSPGSGISTSNYILTTDASGAPTWTDTIDGGIF